MADHGGGAVEFDTSGGDDYAAHAKAYGGFINFAKYGSLAIIILLILMAFFLL
jgi:hypothetical protein